MRLLACILAALATAAPAAGPLRADEATSPVVLTTLKPSSPCGFFRAQAWGKGLDSPATEMLWACEAIATRRAAGIPLGIRLEATELALDRYREALHAATKGGFSATSGRGPTAFYPSDSEKRQIADTTGVLAALTAISGRY